MDFNARLPSRSPIKVGLEAVLFIAKFSAPSAWHIAGAQEMFVEWMRDSDSFWKVKDQRLFLE